MVMTMILTRLMIELPKQKSVHNAEKTGKRNVILKARGAGCQRKCFVRRTLLMFADLRNCTSDEG